MNTPVSFELAKLLKKKEFLDKNIYGEVRLSQPKFYDNDGIIHNIKDAFEKTELNLRKCYNAPTISVVVMWLHEKHGIWIYALRMNQKEFYWSIDTDKKEFTSGENFKTPTKAYEAAIEYILKNLL